MINAVINLYICRQDTIIGEKVFKNGPNGIFQGLSSKNFTWSILEYFALFYYSDYWQAQI